MLVWSIACVACVVAALCARAANVYRRTLERSRLHLDYAPAKWTPAPHGASKQRTLLAYAERHGVTTQWLKDLGYTVVEGDERGAWRVVAPVFTSVAERAARSALTEMFAVAKVDPMGARVAFPDDSWMLIAKAIDGARGESA